MARVGGVARNAQINYEKGDRNPDSQYLSLVCGIGVDVNYVITGMRIAPAVDTLRPREAALLENFKKMAEEDKCAIERLVTVLPKAES